MKIGDKFTFPEDRVRFCCPFCGESEVDMFLFTWSCGFMGEWESGRNNTEIVTVKNICANFIPIDESVSLEKICDCTMENLMRYGCKCGGK